MDKHSYAPPQVLNALYKRTSLQEKYHANMVVSTDDLAVESNGGTNMIVVTM